MKTFSRSSGGSFPKFVRENGFRSAEWLFSASGVTFVLLALDFLLRGYGGRGAIFATNEEGCR